MNWLARMMYGRYGTDQLGFFTLLLMLIFGFWFVTEVSCQIIYGDIEKVFHIEESIRKMKDAELEAALKEDYDSGEDDTEK